MSTSFAISRAARLLAISRVSHNDVGGIGRPGATPTIRNNIAHVSTVPRGVGGLGFPLSKTTRESPNANRSLRSTDHPIRRAQARSRNHVDVAVGFVSAVDRRSRLVCIGSRTRDF